MRVKIAAAITTAALFLSGCNSVAPDDRIDRTELTKNMNFAEVKKAYMGAVYDHDKKLQNIYFQYLADNRERVNPFLNLQNWKKEVESNYKRDSKIIYNITNNIEKMKCYKLEKSLLPLYKIWHQTNAKIAYKTRVLVAQKMREKKCGKSRNPITIDPKNPIEWLWDDK